MMGAQVLRTLLIVGLLSCGSCDGTGLPLTDQDLDPGQRPLSVVADPHPVRDGEPNDSFSMAGQLHLASGPLTVQGAIDPGLDVDVFALGPLNSGDHFTLVMSTEDTLTGSAGLFDANGSLVMSTRSSPGKGGTPMLDLTIREDSFQSFLVIAATPGYKPSGSYELEVSRRPTHHEIAPRPDRILLMFDGAEGVDLPGQPHAVVPPFDAGRILKDFEGDTGAFIAAVTLAVRKDFAPFDVEILSSAEGSQFEPGMSIVYFGGHNRDAYGIASSIDAFNATQEQAAIVFTEVFAAFAPLRPSLAELSQAVANVASHEVGHLLGLVHTEDPAGIMDVTAFFSEMLADQEFRRSPLYSAEFPLGMQDARAYLLSVVGPSRADARVFAPPATHASRTAPGRCDGPAARAAVCFSSCQCGVRYAGP